MPTIYTPLAGKPHFPISSITPSLRSKELERNFPVNRDFVQHNF